MNSSADYEAEVNTFLCNHKILLIDRRFVDLGANSFWAICVEYYQQGISTANKSASGAIRNRIDYKQILSAPEFEVFSQLRSCRKEIAQAEAVPVYTIFTNEQLAQMVQSKCQSKADLQKIEGVGESRLEKYAAQVLSILSRLNSASDA